MNPHLQTLLTFVVVGRVVLSLLPAGWPGGHDRRELGVTLATSYLLGLLALIAQGAIASRLDWQLSTWLHILPWVALGALRLALRPAALRPRHEPPPARADALARAGFLVGWLGWLALGIRLASEVNPAAALGVLPAPLCGAIVAVAGLERARRSPRTRAAAWVAWSGVMLALGDVSLSTWGWLAGFFALGVTGTIAWLRRADRRGLALAALGFAAIGIAPYASPLGAAGLVALVVCTPAASRRRALTWAVTAGAVVVALIFSCLQDFILIATQHPAEPLRSLVWLLPLMALPMTVVWVKLARPALAPTAIEPPRRELLAYGVTLSLAVVAAAIGDAAGGSPARDILLMLLPAAVVFLLLAFAPAERAA